MSDHKPTSHWWARIISRDNAKQVSTWVGTAAIGVGGVLQTTPNPWAQVAGIVLVGLGGTGVGHNSNP